MIAEQISDAKRSLRATAGIAGWAAAAVITIVCALLMFCVAFFIFLADRYDALTASLIMGIGLVVLAGIFVAMTLYLRGKREQERRIAAARRSAQSISWMEPAILAAGLDLARMIGGRRAASLAAGAVAAMWLLSKTNAASSDNRRSL